MREHISRPSGCDRGEFGQLLRRLKHGYRCDDCRARMSGQDAVRWAPMLKDDVWRAIGCGTYTLLCFGCCERRLGHSLSEDDLSDVPFNHDSLKRARR
jgi:hypothetical protein